MVDFSRLSRSWLEWNGVSGTADVSVSTESDYYQIVFKSVDESYSLRHEGDWWITDEEDDRGQRFYGTAEMSPFELMEKYLIWQWARTARSAVGLGGVDARLYSLGMALDVHVEPTDREYTVELRVPTGSAILEQATATIFSHLISKSVDEVEQMFTAGLR